MTNLIEIGEMVWKYVYIKNKRTDPLFYIDITSECVDYEHRL
jgi:hypothetical protein